MRLYLSSFRHGDHPERLVEQCGDRKIAIIANALDFIPAEARRQYEANIYSPSTEFNSIGLDSEDLDLRKYFGRPEDLARELRRFGMVWVLGGNAFLLMRAMRQSGFSNVIVELLRNDQIAYGGFSAGAVVAAPHLRGLELMDDPSQLADHYEHEVVWDGLGLVDFAIVPHCDSDHAESHLAAFSVAFMKANGIPHLAMRDGDVFVSNDGNGQLLAAKSSKPDDDAFDMSVR